MSGYRTAADLIAELLQELSAHGVAVLEMARTGYGLHLWMAAREPGKGAEVRLYVLTRKRGRWTLGSRPGCPWAEVPPAVLEAAR